ncbi:hypothetical protein [Saccharopolyspora sp. NPDC049357]|uniref:hypothetical protein n=1 Tax=Saccharopolyspora sp. NPDC049357 TaxID=3154507 RepID=UPI0034492AC7
MNRKTLLGITIGWAVLIGLVAAVLLGMAMFSGTSLAKSTTASGSSGPAYSWDGKPMMITSSDEKKTAVCRVVPERGEAREVTSYRAESRYQVNRITPWFSGSAKMTCTTPVRVRTGSQVTVYELATKNRIAQLGAAVVAVAPFLAVSVFGLGVRKTHA